MLLIPGVLGLQLERLVEDGLGCAVLRVDEDRDSLGRRLVVPLVHHVNTAPLQADNENIPVRDFLVILHFHDELLRKGSSDGEPSPFPLQLLFLLVFEELLAHPGDAHGGTTMYLCSQQLVLVRYILCPGSLFSCV